MALKDQYKGWALVTGASSGIGQAFARYLAREGIPSILVARRAHRLKALAQELETAHGVISEVVVQDLTAPDMLANLIQRVGDRPIDILVNNAGFGLYGDFHKQSQKQLLDMTLLNVLVPVLLTRHFVPEMVKRGKGAVLFISSVLGYKAFPMLSLYSATKGFNLLLGESLYAELKKSGVKVLSMAPGATDTEFHSVAQMKINNRFNPLRHPDRVVKTAFANLGKRPSAIDGWVNDALVKAMELLPRRWTPEFLKRLMWGRELTGEDQHSSIVLSPSLGEVLEIAS